ncbi:hypothetical protein WG899_22105 [Paucibacter sp. AS339]|uniref:hypothetical protein n=1 Tax=Paucibacter hankyongi TaxID=3133434 RepID=UPI003097FE5E
MAYKSLAAVIISSRETTSQLLACLHATLEALYYCTPKSITIDIIVNGNTDLAEAMRVQLETTRFSAHGAHCRVRLWSIPFGDKAHALNIYWHEIYSDVDIVYFVDGYACMALDSAKHLASGLQGNPDALAAAAVPSEGRSAPELRREMVAKGGLHGNLFAVRGQVVRQFRSLGFRLPLGLYRTDATVGSALSFGLDPAQYGWSPMQFIQVVETATWTLAGVGGLSWDLRQHWRRRLRQARGALENWAVRYRFHLQRQPIACLPSSVQELVQSWAEDDSAGLNERLRGNWLRLMAWRNLRSEKPLKPALQSLTPILLLTCDSPKENCLRQL